MNITPIKINNLVPNKEIYVGTKADDGSIIFTPLQNFIESAGCILVATDTEKTEKKPKAEPKAKKEAKEPEKKESKEAVSAPPKRRGRPPKDTLKAVS